MNRCADCKHWVAEMAPPHDGWEECIKARSVSGEAHGGTMAIAEPDADTYDGSMTRLYTHPDFGCAQWEAK